MRINCGQKIFLRMIALLVILLLIFSFCGCADQNGDYVKSGRVKLTVASGEGYTPSENVFEVERGEDIKLTLRFEEGRVFKDCSYRNHVAVNTDERTTMLTLKDVRFPSYVTIETELTGKGISYDANGGYYLFDASAEGFVEWIDYDTHIRYNTNIGTGYIKRDGYTLLGWNTSPDGAGETIGLGSRVSVPDKTLLKLYAKWAKQLPAENFRYETDGEGAVITEYTGDRGADPFVIPNEIDGKKVVRIQAHAFSYLTGETLVFPDTLEDIENRAFTSCSFQTVYLFDNLFNISERCFTSCKPCSTLHLNAVLEPRYLSCTEVSHFADRMDRLIGLKDKKKIVFFAGCSMSYGLDSAVVDAAFADYEIVDMGTMGEISAEMQVDCITQFLSEGDIFVHAPEQAAPGQMFDFRYFESSLFVMCEGNYDLLSYMDASKMQGVFDAYHTYCMERLTLKAGSYADSRKLCNIYGDVVMSRPYRGSDEKLSEDTYTFLTEYITEENVNRMCDYYDAMREKGVKVFFSFAPINYDGLPEEAIKEQTWLFYEAEYRKKLGARGYEVISDVTDYMMQGRYFYNSDFHLNDVGVRLRTERIIEDIKKALNNQIGR